MDGRKLRDRLYMGLGFTARHIGEFADAFHPTGPHDPLDARNRFLKLPATFVSAHGGANQPNFYGDALWHGIFDASYTRVGDYLVTDFGTYFVASQDPLLPVLCVRTNRTISITQPDMQTRTASNAYGGYTSGNSITLMARWPASVLGEHRSSHSTTDLPADQGTPYWNVLIPSLAGVVLSPGDILRDDLGRAGVITGSELTNLGWRIGAKMATT
jgi:hypothetical protein